MVIKKILACYNFCIRLVTKKNKTNIPRLSNGQSTRASNVPLVYSFRLTYSFPRKDNARQRRRDANVNVDCTLTCYFPFEMVEKKICHAITKLSKKVDVKVKISLTKSSINQSLLF